MSDVRIDGDSAPIDPEGVVAAPDDAASADLVVANDDDLTYAISRLDERSTDVVLAYAGTTDVAITRAVIWASLWNAMRDGLLDPRHFVVAVLNAVLSETEPVIRDRLLLLVTETISSFLPGQARSDVHDQVLVTTIRLPHEIEDSDAWRSYTRVLIAELAACGGDEHEATARDFASSDNPDVAWYACRALAARGLVGAESIEAWCNTDGSGEITRMSVEILASLSLEEARARAWELVFSDSLSNGYLTTTLAGLQVSSWESETGIKSAVEHIVSYWESHTIGMALRYASGVLTPDVDIDRDNSVERSVGLPHRRIDEYADVPAQLCHIVAEHLDSFERDECVQRRWSSSQ